MVICNSALPPSRYGPSPLILNRGECIVSFVALSSITIEETSMTVHQPSEYSFCDEDA